MDSFIRRSQLISTYGIGAMIEFPEETLITAGMDFWPHVHNSSAQVRNAVEEENLISDARLQKRLSAILKQKIDYFVSPAIGKIPGERSSYSRQQMPFFRFPTWVYCPRCRVLKSVSSESQKPPVCSSMQTRIAGQKACGTLPPYARPRMRPPALLIACQNGHLDDFPWSEWVHRRTTDCSDKSEHLYLLTSAGEGLGGLRVYCHNCKKSHSLAVASTGKFPEGVLENNSCTGNRPWLGKGQKEECNATPQIVQRNQLSVYSTSTVSSILIPPYSESIRTFLAKKRDKWDLISYIIEDNDPATVDGKVVLKDGAKEKISEIGKKAGFDPGVFVETCLGQYFGEEDEFNSEDEEEQIYRFREFNAFTARERPTAVDRRDFDIINCPLSDYQPWLSEFFDRIVRVEQLRETRAFVGFSRLSGQTGVDSIQIKKQNWLPAVEVRGEGIFFEFNKKAIADWKKLPEVVLYSDRLKEKIRKHEDGGGINYSRKPFMELDPVFILVHTFAHALIRQLAFDCGYDASSMRERIFVESDPDREMSGVLIYTASGDTEGSLGGLVERAQPEYLETLIEDCIAESSHCSNDPICLESEHQGLLGMNGAACHACILIPETSCEHSNFLLNRQFLVGSYDAPNIGFFEQIM